MAKKPPVDTTRLNSLTADQVQALRMLRSEEAANQAALEPPSEAGSFAGAGFLGGSQYDQTLIEGTNQERARAVQQGPGAELGNMFARIGYNLVPGVIGSIAAMADLPDYLAGITQQEEVGNAVTDWANKQKEKTNQERFPIYKQDPGKVLDIGSTEWWTENGTSILGSAAEFAILGFGVGGLISKGMRATEWLKALTTVTDTVTGISRLNEGAQATAIGTNAFLLNHAEGMLEATQVYGSELEKNMKLVEQGKMTEQQAKINAGAAAGHTLNINRANIVLNLTGISSIMKGARGSRNFIRSLTSPQKIILEGGQEYLEESVNFYATNRGEEYGKALREGKDYNAWSALYPEKFVEDVLSARGLEAGLLGALGGVMQTGAVTAVNKIRGVQDVEKTHEAAQKAVGQGYEDLRNENKLKSIRDFGVAATTLADLGGKRANLEAEIQKAKDEGRPVSNDLIAEWQQTNDAIQDQQLHASFQMGTTEYTEKAYRDIENLTQEEALKNGFTGSELDEKSPAYYKHTARRMQERLTKLEKEYNKTQGYNNAFELYTNRVQALRTKEKLDFFTKKEAIVATAAQEAVDRLIWTEKLLARTENVKDAAYLGAIELERLKEPGYEKLQNVSEDVIAQRKKLIDEAKQLPEVERLEEVSKARKDSQTEFNKYETEYSEQTRPSYQEKLRKETEAKNAEKKAREDARKLEVKAAGDQMDHIAAEIVKEHEKKQAAFDTQAREKGIPEEDLVNLKSAINKEVNTPVGQQVQYTAEEEAMLDKYPQEVAAYRDQLQADATKDLKHKPNALVYTASDDLATDAFLVDLTGTPLETAANAKIEKSTGKVYNPEKLHRANNLMAWLSRAYDVVKSDVFSKIFVDVNNKLNDELKDPTVLDARTLKIGDDVVLKIDVNGIAPELDAKGQPVLGADGQPVYIPWAEYEAKYRATPATLANHAPIGIYRKGENVPIGYVHLPGWITTSRVEGDDAFIQGEIDKVIHIRNAVHAAGPSGIATKITQRTLGKLFLDAKKAYSPVSVNLQDPDLEYVVFYKNRLLASEASVKDTDKLVLNRDKLRSGTSYVLIPVEKNVKPELTKYWAIPLQVNKIQEQVADSIVKATEIFLRSLDGGKELTAADRAAAKSIIEMQKNVKDADGRAVNFDITTEQGIINYTELFVYNHTTQNTASEVDENGQPITSRDLDFDEYFVQKYGSLPTDYFAHKFNRKKGLQFGSGKGVVPKLNPQQYMQAWKAHLLNRYQHTSLRFLSNKNVKLPLINQDNTVSELAPGNTYLSYLKEKAWNTKIIGHNVATGNQPANWVYTIQQMIEFDTQPFGVKNVTTTKEDLEKAQKIRDEAIRAAQRAEKEKAAKQGKPTTIADVEAAAKKAGVDINSDAFKVTVEILTGKRDLKSLDSEQLDQVIATIEKQVKPATGGAPGARYKMSEELAAKYKANDRAKADDLAFIQTAATATEVALKFPIDLTVTDGSLRQVKEAARAFVNNKYVAIEDRLDQAFLAERVKFFAGQHAPNTTLPSQADIDFYAANKAAVDAIWEKVAVKPEAKTPAPIVTPAPAATTAAAPGKTLTKEEYDKRSTAALKAMDDDLPSFSGAKALNTAVTGQVTVTPEQTAINAAEEAATLEILSKDLLSETAYGVLNSKYTLPKSEHLDNVLLKDLLDYWTHKVVDRYNDLKQLEQKDQTPDRLLVEDFFNELKAVQEDNLRTYPLGKKLHNIAQYTLDNWDVMQNLIKSNLQRQCEFQFKVYTHEQRAEDEANRLKSLEDGANDGENDISDIDGLDERESLGEGWMKFSLSHNPAKGLSPKFRRFLAGIKDTSRFYLVSKKEHPNFNPVTLYRTLSALLSDMDPDIDQMLEELEFQATKPQYAYLTAVIEAIRNADQQTQGEFVSTASKHYVQMMHLYVIQKTNRGFERYYEGYPRNDNDNARTIVIRNNWESQLYLSKIAEHYNGKDLREGREMYNKTKVNELVKKFEEDLLVNGEPPYGGKLADYDVTEFDIEDWLSQVGITLSPGALPDLKTNGTKNYRKKPKNATNYSNMFYASDGEFWRIYKFLKGIQESKADIFIETMPLTRESAVYRLAHFDAKYNVDALSNSHKSGNKTIFSYADNKYLFDRARALGAAGEDEGEPDYDLMEKLIVSPLGGKYSQELRQILVWNEAKNEFERDIDGKLKYNSQSDFNKVFGISYASLKFLIQKGVPTGNKTALEDLDHKQHMIAKVMLFQNRGTRNAKDIRSGTLFHMTLANKNTMVLFDKLIPGVGLDIDGRIDDATVDMLYDNIVAAEINRMQAFDKTYPPNIKDYDKGQRLFYLFPKLNLVNELFDIQRNPQGLEVARSLVKNITPELRAKINDVIRTTITTEAAFTMQQWEELGMLHKDTNGVITSLDYLDGKYTAWVRTKLGGASVNETGVVNFAANEMAVAYMLHNMNLFQLFTTDPATQYKYDAKDFTPVQSGENQFDADVMDEVRQTYSNITKRLGAEISPGKDGFTKYTGSHYTIAGMRDIKFPSKALAKYEALFKDNPAALAALRKNLNSTDGAEYITLPEKLRFMREHAKLTQEQIDLLPGIESKYHQAIAAIRAGKDPGEHKLNYKELELIFQVDKPIMVGTRTDQNIETKLFIKSAAFTLIPELVQGTDLEDLMVFMSNPDNPIDRMATESSFKLGAPTKLLTLFDDNGKFIKDVPLDPSDVLQVPRRFLRLQQETPYKETTEVTRVSQVSKQAFVNILDVKGFRLPGEARSFTGRALNDEYNKLFNQLYKLSYDELVGKLGIQTDKNGRVTLDHTKLNNVIQNELVERGYPAHDIDALELTRFPKEETDANGNVIPLPDGVKSEWRFKMPIWALAQSGKLEQFLNSIVSNKILQQKFNGYGFVLGPEGGYNFKQNKDLLDSKGKPLTKGVVTAVEDLDPRLQSEIVFTDKFDREKGLLPALANDNLRHQVILPWKFKEDISKYTVNGKLDMSLIDADLLNIYGMRIPNEGPNSTAAIEIVGFFPPSAGDLMIAPADFTALMGSDFDIDKLYTYMYHYVNYNDKLVRSDKTTQADIQEEIDRRTPQVAEYAAEDQALLDKLTSETSPTDAEIEQVAAAEPEDQQALLKTLNTKYPEWATWRKAHEDYINLKTFVEDLKKRKPTEEVDLSRETIQNKLLDIYLAINTNSDKTVQTLINSPSSAGDLRTIAAKIEKAKLNRSQATATASDKISPFELSPGSGSFQSFIYQSSVVAGTAIGAFAVQNTFNALAQTVDGGLRLVKSWGETVSAPNEYVKVTFGKEKFKGNLSETKTRSGKYVSSNIAAMLFSALDHIKEGILDRIGVNSENLSVVNFMLQAQFELETISNFISQDIIQEYTKQLAIHKGNRKKAFAIVTAQKQFAFDDAFFKNGGQDPANKGKDKAKSKIAKAFSLEEAQEQFDPENFEADYSDVKTSGQNPTRERFLDFYNMGAKELFKYIEQGESAPEYKQAQYVLLVKFQHLHKNAAPKVRQLQSLSNIDSKGIGANMFQSLIQQDDIEELGKSQALDIENAGKLFGDFKLIDAQPPKEEATLLKDGYVRGKKYYFKPTSIPGFAYAYAVITNNKIWQEHFPYAIPEVYKAVTQVSAMMKGSAGSVFNKTEQYLKIFRELKGFALTDNLITTVSPAVTRKLMLHNYDEAERDAEGKKIEHQTLVDIMYSVKHNPATAQLFRENTFLSNLFAKAVSDKRYPKVVMFRQAGDDETTNRDIYNDAQNLIKYPVDFGVFNGRHYTSRTFMENLLLAANVSMTSATQLNLLQFFPTDHLVTLGYADRLHDYDWAKLHQNAAGEPYRSTVQYFQHFPTLTPELNLNKHVDPEYTRFGHDDITDEELKSGFTLADKQAAAARSEANIRQFTLKADFPKDKAPTFWHLPVGKKVLLFQLTDADSMEYSRISTLLNSADSNSHEYNANVGHAVSIISENNPHVFTVPQAVVGRQNLPPRDRSNAQEQGTDKDRVDNVKKILAGYGVRREAYQFSPEQLDQLLFSIAQKNNAAHIGIAQWLRNVATAKDSPNKQFHINFTFEALPEDKKGTTRLYSKEGHLQVWINPYKIDSDNGAYDFEHTVLHEMVHGVTVLAIMQGEHAGKTQGELSHAQARAYKNLNELFEKYKAKYANDATAQALMAKITAKEALTKEEQQEALDYVYPGKNLQEFLAGIMLRPQLRQRLQNLEYAPESHTKETFWNRIIKIFDYLLKAMKLEPGSTAAKAVKDILFLSEKGNVNFANSDTLQIPVEKYSVIAPPLNPATNLTGSIEAAPPITEVPDVQSNEPELDPTEAAANDELYRKQAEDRAQKVKEDAKEKTTVKGGIQTNSDILGGDLPSFTGITTPGISNTELTAQLAAATFAKKAKQQQKAAEPKVSLPIARLLAEREFTLKQLSKHEAALRAELRDFEKLKSREDIKRLHKRIAKVKERKEAIEVDRANIIKLTTLEHIAAVGKSDMKALAEQLIDAGKLDIRDFHILRKRLNLWLNYADNFLDEADKTSLTTQKLFEEVANTAATNSAKLLALQQDRIYNWSKDYLKRDISPETFYSALKDIGWLGSFTLGLDNSNHPLTQAMAQAVVVSEADQVEEFHHIQQEIKKLFALVEGKEHLTGKNFSNFFEVDEDGIFTGNLVRAYSPKFVAEKDKLLGAVNSATSLQGKAAARRALDKFRQQNELFFDLRKLVKLPGFEDMHTKDAGKLEAELKKTMGEIKYNETLKEAELKYQEYKWRAENQQEYYEAEYKDDPEHVTNAMNKWLKSNSVEDYWEHMTAGKSKKTNATSSVYGWQYAYSVPKATNAAGKSQYSEQYLKLQQDADVAAVHKYVLDLLKKLRSYIPPEQQGAFAANSVPTLEKDMIEMLKTEGIAAAGVSMADKLKMAFTSKEDEGNLYGANENTRSLGINVKTLANDIDVLYKQKIQDYERSTGEILVVTNPAHQQKLLQFKQAASEEIKRASSLDLPHLLAIFSQALTMYRHKAKIEDFVRLAEETFITSVKERLENSAGEAVSRQMPEGQSQPEYLQTGHANHIRMLKNFVNHFFGVRKPVEGQTEHKVYTNVEATRLDMLKAELAKHQADLAMYEKQIENLKSTTEGLSEAEALKRSDEISAAQAKKTATATKITDVNAEIAKLGQYVTGTGGVNVLLKGLVVKGLGWNVFGGLTNAVIGTVSNFVEAAGERWYNEKEMRQAYGIALNSTVKAFSAGLYANQTAKKLNLLMSRLDILKSVTKDQFRNENISDTMLGNLHWGQVYKTTEYLNQGSVLVAMMLHHKIKDLTGKESNLWEAFGETGQWDSKRFGEMNVAGSTFTSKDLAFFKAKVDEVIRNNHGNYAKAFEIALKEQNLGKMLSVFRGWMFEGFRSRFEEESINYVQGFKRKGRYRSFAGSSAGLGTAALGTIFLPGIGTAAGLLIGSYLGNKFRNSARFKEGFENTSAFEELAWTTKYLIKKLSFGVVFGGVTLDERFNETDAVNLRRNMAEISFLLYVTGAMAVFGFMLKGDDDDDEKSRVLMYNLNVLHRLQQDLSFYANPITTVTILQDPLPALGLVNDSFKFIKATAGIVVDPASDEIPTGIYAHESKWKRSAMRMFPGTKAIQSFWNMTQQEIKDQNQ